MGSPRDYTGYRNGRLIAVRPTDERKLGKIVWECRCDCGNAVFVPTNHLANNQRFSCGCAKQKGSLRVPKRPVHGHHTNGHPTKTYASWSSMRTRCLNPRVREYPDYGGRGIRICERWERFENFLADMGERPHGKTLDRIDVNGDYCAENCRWATPSEQLLNQRKSRFITANGITKNLSVWSRERAIPKKTITDRLKRGMSPEKALCLA
jgi:hypothetical protein